MRSGTEPEQATSEKSMMAADARMVFEDSGLHYGPIRDDPDGMIAEIGMTLPEGAGLMLTNLSVAESKVLRDWLSVLIAAAEAGEAAV